MRANDESEASGLPISALSFSGSLLVVSRQLMLSTRNISAVDVGLETPIDEAEARLGGVSPIVGRRPLSCSIPFQLPSWGFLEEQSKLHSLSSALGYVPGRPRTVGYPLKSVAC